MLGHKLFRTVRPYFSALAVIATAGVLVFTIYFTQLSLQWTAFLTGILVAAILAEATRVSRAEWTVMRRTAQLSSLKDKLERETVLHAKAEERIAADKPRLHLLDEVLPSLVALIDADGRFRYHNRAFREWLHLRPEQIDNRHLREIVGSRIYEEIEPDLQRALHGKTVHRDRMLTMQDGAVYHLAFEYVPQFGNDEKVTAAYLVASDITEHRDVVAGTPVVAPPTPPQEIMDSQELFIDSLSEQIIGEKNAAQRIIEAIERSEFRLLQQLIMPLANNGQQPKHYEILIRLIEEEESMMPPGAFFPLAEKHGLMPFLDRWVVKHVLELAAEPKHRQLVDDGSMFFINVAKATLRDRDFPGFVAQSLQECGLPGSVLCFEVPNSELAAAGRDIARFVQALRGLGCRAALSGFGRGSVAFDLIRGFQVEFLKIDGSVILNFERDPVNLAKASAINRVAQKLGVKTIAEFVESEETIVKLREIGIDFAQGFGISKPHPFEG